MKIFTYFDENCTILVSNETSNIDDCPLFGISYYQQFVLYYQLAVCNVTDMAGTNNIFVDTDDQFVRHRVSTIGTVTMLILLLVHLMSF